MSQNPVLHLGSARYVLVKRGSPTAGERVELKDRVAASAMLAKLWAEHGNQEVMRATLKQMGGVPAGFGGTPSEGEWAPLTEALASGSMELVRLLAHPVWPCRVTTTGTLTLSEVSWGETAGVYPGSEHLYQPDKWDGAKICELLKARSAINDVATRNSQVQRATPGSGAIDQLLRPYHCIENFPKPDVEIDDEVEWYYLGSSATTPAIHPGTKGTKIVKSYGPFYNSGGGDAPVGPCYLLFYKLAAR